MSAPRFTPGQAVVCIGDAWISNTDELPRKGRLYHVGDTTMPCPCGCQRPFITLLEYPDQGTHRHCFDPSCFVPAELLPDAELTQLVEEAFAHVTAARLDARATTLRQFPDGTFRRGPSLRAQLRALDAPRAHE